MIEKVQRRTQAERSSATREALLAATIETLFEHGYGATSTMLVAERAGVSRGAMQHQFRTKTELMVFVVEAVFEQELRFYAERLQGVTEPRERLLTYVDIGWQALSRPSGVAVLEILQGSRSDPDLGDKLRPIQARIEQEALASANIGSAGDERGALATMRLIVWAIRGLSIAEMLAPAPGGARTSIRLLKRLVEAGMQTGVLSMDAPGSE